MSDNSDPPVNFQSVLPINLTIQQTADPLPKWEYKVIGFVGGYQDIPHFVEELNELGADGWQVCERISSFNLLLIRQIPAVEEDDDAIALESK